MTTSTNMHESNQLSAGQRVIVRGLEWLVTKVTRNAMGNLTVFCTGISPLVRDYEAVFLDDLDLIEPVDPINTQFKPDVSPKAADSHLFVESLIRSTAPTATDGRLHLDWHHANMDLLPYQLVPAERALARVRQRILIADAVGLGKTLEAGILMSELIRRGRGRRILVVTTKSMMAQFQQEMWERFTIPLISLDSSRIQTIRQEIPANANPFSYYDKVIVSIDTLKRDIEYGAALDSSWWDIIVIDEAQNVADRGTGTVKAQRARLAQRLASRSDTLIMLSATPHDGRARSFASLMNMLDPTTLPDPESYDKEDVRNLYVRRFKKDIRRDVSGNFPERKVTKVPRRASAAEEHAFDMLTSMHLAMDSGKRQRTNAGLFTTLLEKSLFSSPAACLKTIEERLKKLNRRDQGDNTGDADKLLALADAVKSIEVRQCSRYMSLLDVLADDAYGWNPDDTNDRVVIFTERIETKKFLETQLRKDLKSRGLAKESIVSMDGSMSDIDQQDMVRQFNDPASPIRVLIASDVASEGLNLHHLCHRLIHFDTPWSLMVFQQRNGRVDRYGQRKQPDIRFLTVESFNEKIKGDARILEILIDKEQQAYKNIGDPALLMGKFSVDEEETYVRRAMEGDMGVDEFAESLTPTHKDIDDTDDGDAEAAGPETDNDDLFSYLFDDHASSNDDAQSRTEIPATSSEGNPLDKLANDRTLMSDYDYVHQGLERFAQVGGYDVPQSLRNNVGMSVRFHNDSSLRAWLRNRVPDNSIVRDEAIWSPDKEYMQYSATNLRQRLSDNPWNPVQYLWELNPVTDWVSMKATSLLYSRNEAPIIAANGDRLDSHDVIVLLAGTMMNRKAAPLVSAWRAMRYRDGEFVAYLETDELWKITGYRGSLNPANGNREYANRHGGRITAAQSQEAHRLLPDAVRRMRDLLDDEQERYQRHADMEVIEQLQRMDAWKQQRSLLLASRGGDDDAEHRNTEKIYADYKQWVEDSLNPSGSNVVNVVAAFVGTEE